MTLRDPGDSENTFRGFLVQSRLVADDMTRVGTFVDNLVGGQIGPCEPMDVSFPYTHNDKVICIIITEAYNIYMYVSVQSRLLYILCMYIYSLAPGVSFDLLQCLYKLEHHTVLCCSAYIRYMHCGPDIICTAGLSVMITPGPQAINQLKHPIVRDLVVYTHSACIPARSLTGVF